MLCQFARQFPPLVADFLERGRQFKRRLREETVTDLMMVNLRNLGSDQIIVDFPDEPTTGADMEMELRQSEQPYLLSSATTGKMRIR
jgi:hypothetical protein